LPVFLLWLFLVWVIVLFGAIFVCSLNNDAKPVGDSVT
jgi:uncharacterized BrkB/YihY/UPF0761 family membrane protein